MEKNYKQHLTIFKKNLNIFMFFYIVKFHYSIPCHLFFKSFFKKGIISVALSPLF